MAQDTDLENGPDSFSGDGKMIFSENDFSAKQPKWYEDFSITAGLILSAAWGFVVVDYVLTTGWWAARFDMTPPEFMSFVAGALSPFAFIWVAAAYFSAQRKYVREAGKLRAYISEFMHPNAKNKLYVKSLLDDIRQQTADLNTVYARLKECTADTGTVLSERVGDLTEIARGPEQSVD